MDSVKPHSACLLPVVGHMESDNYVCPSDFMKLDELIGFYKAVWAMNMKGIMDVLNTLFHMPTLHHSPNEPCYYAAWALEQASGKDRSLLFYQESDFTELRSTLSACLLGKPGLLVMNAISIPFLLTWKSGIFMASGKFFLTLTIQKKFSKGQNQTSLFYDIAWIKRFSFSLALFHYSFLKKIFRCSWLQFI